MACSIVTVKPVEDSPVPADHVVGKHHQKDGKFQNPWDSWQPWDPEAVKHHLMK